MITLRTITLGNRRAMFNLEVSEEQRRFVASNLSSVASCYVLAVNGGHPFPFIMAERPAAFFPFYARDWIGKGPSSDERSRFKPNRHV